MYMTVGDVGYIITLTICGICGILANTFLLYLITQRSPAYLTPYRIFLGNTALTQLLYSLVLIMIVPRILSYEMRIVVIYLGPTQFMGPWACYMLFVTMLHFAVNSFISIMLSMIFRCISLRTLGFPVSGAYFMCLLGYIIPLTMVLSALDMEAVSDIDSIDRYINYSVPHLERYNTVVGVKIEQASALWIIFCVSFLLIPMYIVMYFCRWKIHRMILRPSFVQNHSTQMYIQKLVKALTVQAIIPLFSIFPASLSYILVQFGMLHYQMNSYFVILCLSVSALVDPLVTIHYVNPYRRFTRKCLRLSRSDSDVNIVRASSYEKSSYFRRSFVSMHCNPSYKSTSPSSL